MSIELFASASPGMDTAARLRDDFLGDPRFVVLGATEERGLLLRFVSHAPREQWPEDAEVFVGKDGVRLTFHSATKQERDELVAIVRERFRRAGRDVEFNEE